MLEVLISFLLQIGWLFTLQDIAPIIGFLIFIIIVAVLLIVFVKWYQYWVKRGFEEYDREHGQT